MKRSLFYGRWVSVGNKSAIPPWSDLIIRKGIINQICQRCDSQIESEWTVQDYQYCWQCAKLGLITSHTVLLTLPEPNKFAHNEVVCKWQGELTVEQEMASRAMLDALAHGESHLTYAVTGAGKTEMLFPMLTAALQSGKRVAIVSPRTDVILELAPRIKSVFDIASVVLYGESTEGYHYTQLVLATTHQLLRFYRAFDVIIIDEVDAFPFAESDILNSAAKKAIKAGGVFFYLTATPSRRLQSLVTKGQLKMSLLARRFHGYELPNFKLTQVRNWRRKLPYVVKKLLQKYSKTAQQFFIFVPTVSDLMTVYELIKAYLPTLNVQLTHAGDHERHEKIRQVRAGEIQGLITTTILERGVTIKQLDVIIFGADEDVFSKAALIQMAGRCGRSHEFPNGLVLALISERTNKVLEAYNEIKYLNFQGRR